MRLSIRVKQIVGVTAIVGLAVVALSALFTNRLANVVLQESLSRGKMLANTILHRAGGIVTGDVDPYVALREDPGPALHPRIQHLRRQHQLCGDRRHERHGDRPQQPRTGGPHAGRTGRPRRAVIEDTAAEQASNDLRGRRPDPRGARDAETRERELRVDSHRRVHAADAKSASRAALRRWIHRRRRRWRSPCSSPGSLRSCC